MGTKVVHWIHWHNLSRTVAGILFVKHFSYAYFYWNGILLHWAFYETK